MKRTIRFGRVPLFAMALNLALLGACGRGGAPQETTTSPQERATLPQQTETTVQNNTAAPLPAGTIMIKAATASSGLDSLAFVFDQDPLKAWNSQGSAPAWIQLDLGQPVMIGRVRLLTAQTPAGPTKHEILGGSSPDSLTTLGVLEGDTADTQWLESPVKAEVRYLRIVTEKSPSWVAWREIEVYK